LDDSAFRDLKRHCNGMLHPTVYRRLYETAKSYGGTIVEVGTAHAAGTVALALGLKTSGTSGRIYSIEKIVGGSREAYGTPDENLSIIRGNLKHFGVEDSVELLIGDVSDLHKEIPPDREISMLVLDADGQIDRDFMLFFNRLRARAPIMIDDCEDSVQVKRKDRYIVAINQKKKLTWMLTRFFTEQGWIAEGKNLHGTLFTCKTAPGPVAFDPSAFLAIYRQLVITEGELVDAGGKRIARGHRGLKKKVKRLSTTLGLRQG
jgi:predicted O-methyltransferase YrrM